jgi:hypothetical protein
LSILEPGLFFVFTLKILQPLLPKFHDSFYLPFQISQSAFSYEAVICFISDGPSKRLLNNADPSPERG